MNASDKKSIRPQATHDSSQCALSTRDSPRAVLQAVLVAGPGRRRSLDRYRRISKQHIRCRRCIRTCIFSHQSNPPKDRGHSIHNLGVFAACLPARQSIWGCYQDAVENVVEVRQVSGAMLALCKLTTAGYTKCGLANCVLAYARRYTG